MNKRQRKKLFTGYYRVVSQNPIAHMHGIGEKVKVLSIDTPGFNGCKLVKFINVDGLKQTTLIEQIRPIYRKKRPTKGCTQ